MPDFTADERDDAVFPHLFGMTQAKVREHLKQAHPEHASTLDEYVSEFEHQEGQNCWNAFFAGDFETLSTDFLLYCAKD